MPPPSENLCAAVRELQREQPAISSPKEMQKALRQSAAGGRFKSSLHKAALDATTQHVRAAMQQAEKVPSSAAAVPETPGRSADATASPSPPVESPGSPAAAAQRSRERRAAALTTPAAAAGAGASASAASDGALKHQVRASEKPPEQLGGQTATGVDFKRERRKEAKILQEQRAVHEAELASRMAELAARAQAAQDLEAKLVAETASRAQAEARAARLQNEVDAARKAHESSWVEKLSGKWVAAGVDGLGEGLTELILLEVGADGTITGAVDDGDGVFEDDDGDCKITNGRVDTETLRVTFDQIYEDGATTKWEAVYDRKKDLFLSGRWSGECDGTYEARRFAAEDAQQQLRGYLVVAPKPIAVYVDPSASSELVGHLGAGTAAVSGSDVHADADGNWWVELFVKPSPKSSAFSGADRFKVVKAWASMLDSSTKTAQLTRAEELDGKGVDAVMLPGELHQAIEEAHTKSEAHDGLLQQLTVQRQQIAGFVSQLAQSAFERVDTDNDGAVTAEHIVKWHSVEMSLPNDQPKDLDVIAAMIKEYGWELDDEEHRGPNGEPAAGSNAFGQIRTLLLQELSGRVATQQSKLSQLSKVHKTLKAEVSQLRSDGTDALAPAEAAEADIDETEEAEAVEPPSIDERIVLPNLMRVTHEVEKLEMQNTALTVTRNDLRELKQATAEQEALRSELAERSSEHEALAEAAAAAAAKQASDQAASASEKEAALAAAIQAKDTEIVAAASEKEAAHAAAIQAKDAEIVALASEHGALTEAAAAKRASDQAAAASEKEAALAAAIEAKDAEIVAIVDGWGDHMKQEKKKHSASLKEKDDAMEAREAYWADKVKQEKEKRLASLKKQDETMDSRETYWEEQVAVLRTEMAKLGEVGALMKQEKEKHLAALEEKHHAMQTRETYWEGQVAALQAEMDEQLEYMIAKNHAHVSTVEAATADLVRSMKSEHAAEIRGVHEKSDDLLLNLGATSYDEIAKLTSERNEQAAQIAELQVQLVAATEAMEQKERLAKAMAADRQSIIDEHQEARESHVSELKSEHREQMQTVAAKGSESVSSVLVAMTATLSEKDREMAERTAAHEAALAEAVTAREQAVAALRTERDETVAALVDKTSAELSMAIEDGDDRAEVLKGKLEAQRDEFEADIGGVIKDKNRMAANFEMQLEQLQQDSHAQLQTHADNSEVELQALRQQIASERESMLASSEAALTSLGAKSLSMVAHLAVVNDEKAATIAQLSELLEQAAAKYTRGVDRQAALKQEKETELAKLAGIIAEKDVAIATLERQVKEEMQRSVLKGEKSISSMADVSKLFVERDQLIASKQRQIEELTAAVSGDTRRLMVELEQSRYREQTARSEATAQEVKVNSQAWQLTVKDQEIEAAGDLAKMLEESLAMNEERNRTVEQQKAEIESLQADAAAEDQAAADLASISDSSLSLLQEKSQLIVSLRSEISGLEAKIVERDAALDAADESVEAMDQRRAAMAEEIADLQGEMENMRLLAKSHGEHSTEPGTPLSERRVTEREVVRRVAVRIFAARMRTCLSGWSLWTVEAKAWRVALRRCIERMMWTKLAHCFRVWLEKVAKTGRYQAVVKRVLHKMQTASLAASFGFWSDWTEQKIETRVLVEGAIRRMANGRFADAFDAWVAWVERSKEERRVREEEERERARQTLKGTQEVYELHKGAAGFGLRLDRHAVCEDVVGVAAAAGMKRGMKVLRVNVIAGPGQLGDQEVHFRYQVTELLETVQLGGGVRLTVLKMSEQGLDDSKKITKKASRGTSRGSALLRKLSGGGSRSP
jgi:hypothetical protein